MALAELVTVVYWVCLGHLGKYLDSNVTGGGEDEEANIPDIHGPCQVAGDVDYVGRRHCRGISLVDRHGHPGGAAGADGRGRGCTGWPHVSVSSNLLDGRWEEERDKRVGVW